jgi:hypothetical protein
MVAMIAATVRSGIYNSIQNRGGRVGVVQLTFR